MNLNSTAEYLSSKAFHYKCGTKRWIETIKNKILLKRARIIHKSHDNEPLVSIIIPTYNRAKILTERTIPSLLKQTYQNFEVVIVGDHCEDDTAELIAKINDKRIKFHNLPERGKYPEDPEYQWWVAGVPPVNKAVELSFGDWIAPLDDDDEFSEDHIESLLKYALEKDYEMVYGKVNMEIKPGKWCELGSYPLEHSKISRISAIYSSKLNFIKYDINCWKCGEPADWNTWRRMKDAGVKIGFIDKIVGNHYLEGTQKKK